MIDCNTRSLKYFSVKYFSAGIICWRSRGVFLAVVMAYGPGSQGLGHLLFGVKVRGWSILKTVCAVGIRLGHGLRRHEVFNILLMFPWQYVT